MTDTKHTPTHGTYAISTHSIHGFAVITCYGSDVDTLRKGWRSLGCTSVPLARLDANIRALEAGGRKPETRSLAEMSLAALAKAQEG